MGDPVEPSRTPRVLLVATQNQRRGAESFAHLLGTCLRQRGWNAQTVALSAASHPPFLPIDALGRRPLGLATLRRLRRRMATADVVVAHGSKTLPATFLAGAGLAVPVVYQNIGDPLYWAGTRSRHWRVSRMLARAAAVAALTEQSAHVLHTRFGVSNERIRVVRNARDGDTFFPASPTEKVAARRRLGLPQSVLLVTCVGALSEEKRMDVAIRAVATLPDDVQLVLAGDGPLRSQLAVLADEVAPGRVTFLGQVDDVPTVLHATDVVALTSASEGVPGVLIEAGLSGLPVVSSDVGFVRDVVVPGRSGHLVPVGDVDALVRALLSAARDANSLGALARQHCLERFELEHVIDAWARLLHDVGRGLPADAR